MTSRQVGALPPWYQVIKPHQDVRDERFDESIYAASLGGVAEGAALLEYRDARRFFERTYMTDGLQDLLARVVHALAHAGGGHGQRVLDLRTPFGGGKTHALLAVYHLISNGGQVAHLSPIKRLLEKAQVARVPDAAVAVIDCAQANVLEHATLPDGTPVRSLWGLLAYRLGRTPADGARLYSIMAANDRERVSPGEQLIRQLLAEAGPALILLDEVIEYVIKASAQKVGDSNLGSQTITFIRDLAVAVAGSQQTVLVATLVKSEVNQIDVTGVAAYNALEAEFRRVGSEVEPVRGNDIFGVLRARLFEPLDNDTPRHVGQEFEQLYTRTGGSDLPPDVAAGRLYNAEQIARAYPFHPELVAILRDRWGSLPQMQRTRGVLRFLAMVAGRLYHQKHAAPLILPGDVDLEYEPIQTYVRVLVGDQYDAVFSTDIVGKGSHAAQVDSGLPSGELRQQQLARRLARTILLYSVGGTREAERGASPLWLRLGVLTPDMDRNVVTLLGEVLTRLAARCWYLYNEGGIYRFLTIENLNRVLLEQEERIGEEEVAEALRTRATAVLTAPRRAMASGSSADLANVRIVPWPAAPNDVPDTTALQFVYLGPDGQVVSGNTGSALPHAQAVLDKATTNRTHKNRMILLAPDADMLTQAAQQARRLLAIAAIRARPLQQLTPENQEQLRRWESEAQQAFPQLVTMAYRHVLVPGSGCGLTGHALNQPELLGAGSHATYLLEWLRDADLVYTRMSLPTLFRNYPDLWTAEAASGEALSLELLWRALTDVCGLPRPLSEDVLRAAVQDAVSNGFYGYGRGRGADLDFVTGHLWLSSTPPAAEIVFNAEGWLLTPRAAQTLLGQLQPVGPAGSPGPGVTYEPGTGYQFGGAATAEAEPGLPPSAVASSGTGYRRVTLEFDFSGSDWATVHMYIMQQLLRQAARIRGHITLTAEADAGLPQHFVDQQLPESLRAVDPQGKLTKTTVLEDTAAL